MGRVPVNLVMRPAAIEAPARLVSPDFGQAGLEAPARVAAAVSDVAKAAAAMEQEHLRDRMEAESEVEIADGQTYAADQYRQAAETAARTTDVEVVRRAYEGADKAVKGWLEKKNERGVPNVRWAASRRRLGAAFQAMRAHQAGAMTQRVVELARADDRARIEASAARLVQIQDHAGLADLGRAGVTAALWTPEEAGQWVDAQRNAADLLAVRTRLGELEDTALVDPAGAETAAAGLRGALSDSETSQAAFPTLSKDQRQAALVDLDRTLDMGRKRSAAQVEQKQQEALSNATAAVLDWDPAGGSLKASDLVSVVRGSGLKPDDRARLEDAIEAKVEHFGREVTRQEGDAAEADLTALSLLVDTRQVSPRQAKLLALKRVAAVPLESRKAWAAKIGAWQQAEETTTEAARKAGLEAIDEKARAGMLGARWFDAKGADITERERANTAGKVMKPLRLKLEKAKTPEARAAAAADLTAARTTLEKQWQKMDRELTGTVQAFNGWLASHPEATADEAREQVKVLMHLPLSSGAFQEAMGGWGPQPVEER